MNKQIYRIAVSWGNSSGVLLPNEWKNKEVQVILIDRTLEIKKEIFNILEDYLEDILGIYLVGSYARGEQTERSDIDILVISTEVKKEIVSGKYNVSIYPLKNIKDSLKNNPIIIYPRLLEAKTILNNALLDELKTIAPILTTKNFKVFINDTKRIIKMNKEFIELDKLDGDILESVSVDYSIILRLRGIFMIKGILHKQKYSTKEFKNWLKSKIEDYEKAYEIYENFRDDKKIKIKIRIKLVEELLSLLNEEVKKYEKKEKIRKRN